MQSDVETDQENLRDRIREFGLGAELVRERKVKRVRDRMEALYAHGSLADLDALDVALEFQEEAKGSAGAATLVEAFLTCYKLSDLVADEPT